MNARPATDARPASFGRSSSEDKKWTLVQRVDVRCPARTFVQRALDVRPAKMKSGRSPSDQWTLAQRRTLAQRAYRLWTSVRFVGRAFASLDERPLLPDWAFASLDEQLITLALWTQVRSVDARPAKRTPSQAEEDARPAKRTPSQAEEDARPAKRTPSQAEEDARP
ncbi:hypothetical protein LR48_Vigan08g088500 [Vigna angularis]|uniref:Uncharacterized protein n=1 Tax=Phaseolus angularis TaxID=3914 RepID=A0A0L9V533_PHAAN|nr:hypothetical protein LR48_Vigan08g088500 [Vigna angularis]